MLLVSNHQKLNYYYITCILLEVHPTLCYSITYTTANLHNIISISSLCEFIIISTPSSREMSVSTHFRSQIEMKQQYNPFCHFLDLWPQKQLLERLTYAVLQGDTAEKWVTEGMLAMALSWNPTAPLKINSPAAPWNTQSVSFTPSGADVIWGTEPFPCCFKFLGAVVA